MIELRAGDTLRFNCQFTHEGQAYSGAKLRCSVGVKNAWFNEKQFVESPSLNFPVDITPREYDEDVDMVINIGKLPAGTYEAEVKLMGIPGGDIFWYGPLNDITVIGAPAEFSGLKVTYAKL